MLATDALLMRASSALHPVKLPGVPDLRAMIGSFDATAPLAPRTHSYTRAEWNPFSQRLIVDPNELCGSPLTETFQKTTHSVEGVVKTYHEATHVLLLEPFFLGRLDLRTWEAFETISYAFEAAAVWHMENKICMGVDSRLPDGESIYPRVGFSTSQYHHAKSKAASFADDSKLLEMYIEAFSGYPTELLDAKDIFSKNLMARMYCLHFDTVDLTKRSFHLLEWAGVMREFVPRFCHEGLPTVLPESVLAFDANREVHAYTAAFFEHGLAAFSAAKKRTFDGVRLRRRIQTRAYFALCLRRLLETGRYFRRNPKAPKVSIEAIKGSLGDYLAQLESTLKGPLLARTLDRCEAEIAAADRRFELHVRRPLTRGDLWVGRRLLFFLPKPHVRSTEIGMLGADRDVDAAQDLVFFLLDEKSRVKDRQWLLEKIAQLQRISTSKASAKRKREQLDAFCIEPDVAELWSVPLSSIDPVNNQFSELLFLYR